MSGTRNVDARSRRPSDSSSALSPFLSITRAAKSRHITPPTRGCCRVRSESRQRPFDGDDELAHAFANGYRQVLAVAQVGRADAHEQTFHGRIAEAAWDVYELIDWQCVAATRCDLLGAGH